VAADGSGLCTISKSAAVVSMPMTMLTAAGTYESPSNFPNNALLAICGLYGTAGHLGVSRPAQAEITLPILLYKAELDRRHLGEGPIWRALAWKTTIV
jgi:hypothetical protein